MAAQGLEREARRPEGCHHGPRAGRKTYEPENIAEQKLPIWVHQANMEQAALFLPTQRLIRFDFDVFSDFDAKTLSNRSQNVTNRSKIDFYSL
jgi:hypothetical protein